jgi:hypothetical protein
MRRNILSIGVVLNVLLLASQAFAISYSGSALLDWGKLTFSGINITINSEPLASRFTHLAGVMEAGGDIGRLDLTDGAPGFRPGWDDWTVIGSNSIGTLVTAANVTSLYASATMTGSGPFGFETYVISERGGSLVANQTGYLTVSIPYILTHSGIQSSDVAFTSRGLASLSLNSVGSSTETFVDLHTASGITSRTGTLSLTRFFNEGEFSTLLVHGSVTAVPAPEMLWPTLVGMVGIVLYVEMRRRRLVG